MKFKAEGGRREMIPAQAAPPRQTGRSRAMLGRGGEIDRWIDGEIFR